MLWLYMYWCGVKLAISPGLGSGPVIGSRFANVAGILRFRFPKRNNYRSEVFSTQLRDEHEAAHICALYNAVCIL